MINVGIDWAEDSHQVCILAGDGATFDEFSIRDGVEGVGRRMSASPCMSMTPLRS